MASERMKFTEAAVKTAAPNAKFWDTEIKGFGLFTGKETKTFYFQKDVKGKTVRTKLGTWPETRVADARYEAGLLVGEYASGAVAKRLRAAKIPTLTEATAAYIARPKLRSEANKDQVKSQMESHLKAWLKRPLDEITKADCVAAHSRIAVEREGVNSRGRPCMIGGERVANHVLKSFRSIWNHARRTHDLPECPTVAVEWFPEEPSHRIIDDLDAWKKAVDAIENPVHRAYYYFLLLTGLRKEEAMTLRWEQVFDDHLHLPETKNGRAFNLPLLPEHHAILEPMRAYRSEYVFHGTRHAVHLRAPTRLAWSAHDHRRTFATFAENEGGLLEETVGRLLNHTPTSVTGARYIVVGHERLRAPMEQIISAFKRRGLI
ncbi:phage integrase family protein [Defluviimonas denitrificans]|uniref:Phage integrase family protein n=2 Tax=Albidovulum denitrificans TaxID=404881 RepID=A0A2S8SD19_9RHOB|nr:phage integrase family protein [Defluviimonas denitrificans]